MADFSDIISSAIKSVISGMHTCLPGRIESYDYTTQKANVLPLLRDVYSDGEEIDMPVIIDVPVIFPAIGSVGLTFPVNPGDGVLLVFAERSIDKWLSLGGVVTPDDPRRFDLSDAVAIVGLNPFTEASQADNNDDVTLMNDSAKLKLQSGGKVALGNSTNELLAIIEELIDELIILKTVPAALGVQLLLDPTPVTGTIPKLEAVKAKITLIKGTIT